MESVLTVLTYIGVFAFAVSGAMLAIRSEVDLFGVVFLSVLTSFGGGLIRDIILNRYPYPLLFEMKYPFILSVTTAFIVFFLAYFFRDTYLRREKLVKTINDILDSVGLGALAVTGTQAALQAMQLNRAEAMPFVAVVMGMISCIGGGVVRDVILGKLPWVLQKRIYAIAALVGAGLYILLENLSVPRAVSAAAGCLTVFALRVCATVFHWDMPVAIRFSASYKPKRRFSSASENREYYMDEDTVRK